MSNLNEPIMSVQSEGNDIAKMSLLHVKLYRLQIYETREELMKAKPKNRFTQEFAAWEKEMAELEALLVRLKGAWKRAERREYREHMMYMVDNNLLNYSDWEEYESLRMSLKEEEASDLKEEEKERAEFEAALEAIRKPYVFYGWEDTDVLPVREEDQWMGDPKHFYDLLSTIWCAYTCAPRMRKDWRPSNMTLGQCSITAFLVQDIYGGEVYGIPRKGGSFHCYNVVNGHLFDLTSEQFMGEKLCYEGNPLQERSVHFSKQEKYERYQYLKEELEKKRP